MLTFWAIVTHVFAFPTWWTIFELIWLFNLSGYGLYLHRKYDWFQEPVTSTAMFWEFAIMAGVSALLTTDFQLEGVFVILKYHYIKEALKHDHVLRNLVLISIGVVVFIIIAL